MPAGSKEDDAVLAPRSAATGGRIAKGLRRTSSQTQLLQFSIGKEAQRLAIRRPEGKAGAVGVGEAGRILRSRFVDPDDATSVGVPMPDNSYSMAVGGHRYIPRREREWSGKEPGLRGNFRGAPPEDEGDQQQCESACDQPGQQFAPVVLFFRGWQNRSPALRDPLQLQCDVMRGLVALVRILCQAVGNQLLEGRRREWLDP